MEAKPSPLQGKEYQNPDRGDPDSRSYAAAGASASGAAAGLVGLVTSGHWNPLNPEFQRIRRLSRMRRAVLNSGDLVSEGYRTGGFRYRAVMLTLTYREVGEWEPRHVSELVRHLRRWADRRGFRVAYVWVAELQQRGAVHYHLILWLPRGLTLPKPDKQGWWTHGFTNICWARKPVGYLAKYASKGNDVKKFPRGLRLHGRGGLEHDQRRAVSWWLLPRYVREAFPEVGTVVRRVPFMACWLNPLTGEMLDTWKPPPITA